jgi:hypothetical protein
MANVLVEDSAAKRQFACPACGAVTHENCFSLDSKHTSWDAVYRTGVHAERRALLRAWEEERVFTVLRPHSYRRYWEYPNAVRRMMKLGWVERGPAGGNNKGYYRLTEEGVAEKDRRSGDGAHAVQSDSD